MVVNDYALTTKQPLISILKMCTRIDELYASIQGGNKFTKLDFKNAYN